MKKENNDKITTLMQLKINSMNELFVSERKRYILQNADGTYTNNSVFYYNMKLCDNVIENHLTKKSTIGVFSNEFYTPFVLFDVDMEGYRPIEIQMVVNSIMDEINDFGIRRDYIQVSYSGSKGYHIYVHFDNPIYVSKAKMFYGYIIQKCGLSNKMVEFRGCPNVAVKLPLSINKKTGNFCHYVDENFKPIEEDMYVISIRQFPTWIFYNCMDDIKDELELEKIVTKSISEFKTRMDKENIEMVKDVEKNGLKYIGTRHHYTLKIAMLYNTFGIGKVDAMIKLEDWINRQPQHMYDSKIDICIKEIKKAVDWVYKNNARFGTCPSSNISLTRYELDLISNMPNKSTMYMLFAILIYSKQFKDVNNGEFYFTYGHASNLIGISDRTTISKNFKYLIECGILNKVYQGNGFISNKYTIGISFDDEGVYDLSTADMDIRNLFKDSYSSIYSDCELSSMFSKSLIASMIQ
jgi:hypothetical protein